MAFLVIIGCLILSLLVGVFFMTVFSITNSIALWLIVMVSMSVITSAVIVLLGKWFH